MTADPAGNLYLWAGDTLYLHDRAGIGMRQVTSAELQLSGPVRSLAWLGGEGLLLSAGGNAADPNDPPDTLLCQLELNRCSQRWPGVDARGITEHPRTGARYLANIQGGLLSKLDAKDQLVATATVRMPASPVLRLRDGLLFMNSSEDHAVSVFRPDDAGFGQQLDEILLLPPAAIDAGQVQVIDFITLGNNWWVILASEDGSSTGVYRFDSQWNLLGALALPEDFTATAILDWNGRALLLDPTRPQMPKFTGEGLAEVSLEPDGLLTAIEEARRRATLQAQAWRTGLALLALLCAAATIYAYLQRIRSRVYRRGTPRGAEPIDSIAGKVKWVAPATSREAHFRRLGIMLGVVTIGGMMAAIGLQADVGQLAALLVASGAAALSLYILHRSAPGFLGADGDSLVIVDHHNHYHIGAGPRVLYRNNFLMIDDILLFTGNSALPVFDAAQLAALKPAVEAGIRVERKVIWVHLLQSQHPLASTFLVLLVGAAVSLALLAG
jgi:hypothetical protein